MSFQIHCAVDGDPMTAEIIECDSNAGDYWAIRFAVDGFIVKHVLTAGEKITVVFEKEKKRIETYWTVATRTVTQLGSDKAPGQSRVLYYGEVGGLVRCE